DKGDIRNLTRTPVVAERDPAWSPDGKSVAYFSEASGEYNLEIRDQSGLGEPKKINLGNPPSFFYAPQWSPDGQKIAYSDKRLNLWYVDLAKDQGSPLAPESDEEKGTEPKPDEKDKPKKEEPVLVKIDFEGISQRIVALPIPAKNYVNIVAGKAGILFLSEGPQVITEADFPNLAQTLYKWDLEKRKLDKFVEEINDYTVSFNGEKLLYRKGEQWVMAGTEEPPTSGGKPKPGEGPLKLD